MVGLSVRRRPRAIYAVFTKYLIVFSIGFTACIASAVADTPT